MPEKNPLFQMDSRMENISKVKILNPLFYTLSVLNTIPPIFKWLPQSFFIWPLLQYAINKPRHHDNPVSFHLDSYFYWSSGHLSLPPDSHFYADLCPTQPVSPGYFQSVQSTSLFVNKHWWPWCSISDPVRRKQGWGGTRVTVFIKSTVVYSNVLGLNMYSALTHQLTQSNFQSCKPYSW